MIEGLDYAWSKPSPTAMVAGGKAFACRYLSYDASKNLSRAEADALNAAGIAIVCNWEWDSRDALGGYASGVKHATEAKRQALACGMPGNRPIYFSVDFLPSASDWPVIDEHFRGICSVLGYLGCGIYGGYDTVLRAVNHGWCGWYWQTYAWSVGSQVGMPAGQVKWHPSTHIEQYRNGVQFGGADCDLNRALTVDYGQWGVDAPIIVTEDNEMKLVIARERNSVNVYVGNGVTRRWIQTPTDLADLQYWLTHNRGYSGSEAQVNVFNNGTLPGVLGELVGKDPDAAV